MLNDFHDLVKAHVVAQNLAIAHPEWKWSFTCGPMAGKTNDERHKICLEFINFVRDKIGQKPLEGDIDVLDTLNYLTETVKESK